MQRICRLDLQPGLAPSPGLVNRRRILRHDPFVALRLDWATYNGHTDVVRVLLDLGADVNRKNTSGNPPVLYAAAKSHAVILVLLMKNGADYEVRGLAQMTPLIAAARDGHSDAVKVLLGAGERHPKGHEMALRVAKKRGHRSVVELLKSVLRGDE
ncbi:TPA: hypothetical protein DCE37_20675 [Candidatus Latescibacteria bacterium]|nr:hypothetical protein [Candidatus Latescibacterota bacterium]